MRWTAGDRTRWCTRCYCRAGKFVNGYPRECSLQPIYQLGLRRIDLLPRAARIEPFAPVHLGEGEPPPRASGPLGTHHIAPGLVRICLPLPSPGVHELAGLLADAAQRQEGSFGADARLLLELADGRGRPPTRPWDDGQGATRRLRSRASPSAKEERSCARRVALRPTCLPLSIHHLQRISFSRVSSRHSLMEASVGNLSETRITGGPLHDQGLDQGPTAAWGSLQSGKQELMCGEDEA
jgi:hypothetical protein